MPLFYFDLRTPDGLDPDELGAEFPGLEAAYLDACRAAIDMSAEMLRERCEPSRHTFEVRDAERRLVLEIPFREVLRPADRSRRPVQGAEAREAQEALLARSRELRTDVRATVEQARASVRQARDLMRELNKT